MYFGPPRQVWSPLDERKNRGSERTYRVATTASVAHGMFGYVLSRGGGLGGGSKAGTETADGAKDQETVGGANAEKATGGAETQATHGTTGGATAGAKPGAEAGNRPGARAGASAEAGAVGGAARVAEAEPVSVYGALEGYLARSAPGRPIKAADTERADVGIGVGGGGRVTQTSERHIIEVGALCQDVEGKCQAAQGGVPTPSNPSPSICTVSVWAVLTVRVLRDDVCRPHGCGVLATCWCYAGGMLPAC